MYANDNRAEIRGMINTPLGNTGHAMRLTGFVVNGDHQFNNTFNGQGLNDANKWGAKTRFLFNAESAGEFLLTLDYSKENTDCCALAAISYDGLSTLNSPLTRRRSEEFLAELGPVTTPGPRFGLPAFDFTAFEDTEGFSPPPADPFGDDYWLNSDTHNDVEVGGIALEWNRDIGDSHSMTFINAWRHYESDSAFDGDFTAYSAVEAKYGC